MGAPLHLVSRLTGSKVSGTSHLLRDTLSSHSQLWKVTQDIQVWLVETLLDTPLKMVLYDSVSPLNCPLDGDSNWLILQSFQVLVSCAGVWCNKELISHLILLQEHGSASCSIAFNLMSTLYLTLYWLIVILMLKKKVLINFNIPCKVIPAGVCSGYLPSVKFYPGPVDGSMLLLFSTWRSYRDWCPPQETLQAVPVTSESGAYRGGPPNSSLFLSPYHCFLD